MPDSRLELTAFQDVDATGAPAAAVAYLERVAAHPVARAYKEATLTGLSLAPGMAVADVGCGAGIDLPALSGLVGLDGRVIGVNLSAELVAAARRRTEAFGNVEAVAADAHGLPFADDELDAARVDRVLLHVEHPEVVVAELVRVVRPGGRIVLSEGDWGMLVVAPGEADLTRRLFDPRASGIRHPFVGRHLAALIATATSEVLSVDPATVALRSLDEADALLQLRAMADGAVALGRVDAIERERWLASAGEASAGGGFLAALTGFIVVGAVV